MIVVERLEGGLQYFTFYFEYLMRKGVGKKKLIHQTLRRGGGGLPKTEREKIQSHHSHSPPPPPLRPVETDATSHNIVACCWGFLANNIASVCMGLKVWKFLILSKWKSVGLYIIKQLLIPFAIVIMS